MTEQERIAEFSKLCPMDDPTKYGLIGWLKDIGFFTAPASTKYHGAYEGGLYDHSKKVYEYLTDLTNRMGLRWEQRESVFIVAMLHDICKCDCYTPVWKDGVQTWEYNKNTLLTGHGEKSVMLLNMSPLTLTEEEMVCIRYHMGAFVEKEEWSAYTGAIHKYQNVVWTHMADMLAAHVAMT